MAAELMMDDAGLHAPARSSSRLQPRRIQPLRALRALRRLIADKEDTTQVFEIMNALAGSSVRRGYHRMLERPEGARQAFLMIELADRLHDRVWLESLPPGSVGRAYLDFIDERRWQAAIRNARYNQALRRYHQRFVHSRELRVGDLVLR